MIIDKDTFVYAINRLKAKNDTIEKVNDILRNSRDVIENGLVNGYGIMICHEDLVIELLDKMFDTDLVSHWIYELDYGRKYKKGCIEEANGDEIDISTAEKLYDYIFSELKED